MASTDWRTEEWLECERLRLRHFVDGHVKWQRQTGWGPTANNAQATWHLMTLANWTNQAD